MHLNCAKNVKKIQKCTTFLKYCAFLFAFIVKFLVLIILNHFLKNNRRMKLTLNVPINKCLQDGVDSYLIKISLLII